MRLPKDYDSVMARSNEIQKKALGMDFDKYESGSVAFDYEGLMKLYEENPDIPFYLENIVGTQMKVNSIQDIVKAFEADIHKMIGKTIMIWNE